MGIFVLLSATNTVQYARGRRKEGNAGWTDKKKRAGRLGAWVLCCAMTGRRNYTARADDCSSGESEILCKRSEKERMRNERDAKVCETRSALRAFNNYYGVQANTDPGLTGNQTGRQIRYVATGMPSSWFSQAQRLGAHGKQGGLAAKKKTMREFAWKRVASRTTRKENYRGRQTCQRRH